MSVVVTEQYNLIINYKCGIPNAMTGLMARKPKMTECVINLEQSKKECLNACNKMNHWYIKNRIHKLYHFLI